MTNILQLLDEQEKELKQVFERYLAELNLIQGRLAQIQIIRDAVTKPAPDPQNAETQTVKEGMNNG